MDESSREEEIFAVALSQPAASRPGFLDQACAGDRALRDSVSWLLAVHERAGKFLEEPAAGELPSPAGEKPGDRIGRYRLLQKIGEGGCGTVYLAEQVEPVLRRVAVKVIKLGMDTRAVIARFEAERQVLALMDHPNIAKVFDAGLTEGGRPYFVMELVRGSPITRFCDEHALSAAQRITLFVRVCRAIQHAHQKGIIHRDIKPSNILVAQHDAEPVPMVIDFGIAKATQGRLTDHTTAVELFLGTPAYSSPEQASLSALDVDTRSDVYSLGVLLYELLTGRTPFDAKELAQAGLDEVRRQIRETEPPRPSARPAALAEIARETAARQRQSTGSELIRFIRGDLDWIALRCLEKDRRQRYETASGLALDLERFLNHEPVSAGPPTAAYRLRKAIRRNKLAFGAIAAVSVALVAGFGASTWAFLQEKRARERAVIAEQTAVSAARKSEHVAHFLQAMLEGIGPSVALGRDTALLREIVDQTAARLDRDLHDQPAVEAELRETLGRVYFDLGQWDRADAMHEAALRLRRQVHGPEHPQVARSLRHLALVRSALGDASRAETMLRDALAMQQKLLGPENLEVAATLSDLASVLFAKRDPVGAESEQRNSLALQRKLRGDESFAFAGSLSELALAVQARGDLAAAEATAREALLLQRKLRGNEHPAVARSLYALGSVLHARSNAPEAEQVIREALAMQRRLLGNEHPEVARSLQALGSVLYLREDLDEAEATIREAIAIQRKILGVEHPRTAESLRLLAETLSAQFRSEEAENFASQALEIQKKILGEDHLDVADTLALVAKLLCLRGERARGIEAGQHALALRRNYGDLELVRGLRDMAALKNQEGEWPEAVALARERVAWHETRLGPDDRLTIDARVELAEICFFSGDYATARTLAEGSLQQLRTRFGRDGWETVQAMQVLAFINVQAGRFPEAVALLEEAIAIVRQRLAPESVKVVLLTSYLGGIYSANLGRPDLAQAVFEEQVRSIKTRLSPDHRLLLAPLRGLGGALIRQGRFVEAEPILRQALHIAERGIPSVTAWRFLTKIQVAVTLVGQQRYAEAEPLLLDGHKGLVQMRHRIPPPSRGMLAGSARRLVELYEAWHRPEDASRWAAITDQFKQAESSSAAAGLPQPFAPAP